MKRVLSLRNRMVLSAVLISLLFTTSSFTFDPSVDAPLVDNTPQKKEQRLKVIIKKDGKETKIDTTFNIPDEKLISAKVDSMLKKLDVEGLDSGKFNVLVHHPGMRMKYFNHADANFPGDKQFDIMFQSGDSGQMKHMRKIIRMGKDGDVISFNDSEDNELLPPPPPLPPLPPTPPFEMNRQFGGDPFAFDTNDESIISYDKKDIGKGLEKITIIRKKRTGNNHQKDIDVETEVSVEHKK